MSARELRNTGALAAVVLCLAGLIVAEFGGMRSLGFVIVLLGIAAGGGAGSLAIIVREQERQP